MARTSDLSSLGQNPSQLLMDRFRCSGNLANFVINGNLSPDSGYFLLGSDTICHGRCSSGIPAQSVTEKLHDAGEHITIKKSSVQLPFDPVEIVDNFRYERYAAKSNTRTVSSNSVMGNMYYRLRPRISDSNRKWLQRLFFRGWEQIPFPKWPVDRTVEDIHEQLLILSMKARGITRLPFIWFWPEGAPSCTVMTHDVETLAGVDFCSQLMDLDEQFGMQSSFQVVPEERYTVSSALLENIRNRGNEVNIQDLNHDGGLFSDRELFLRRAERINAYGKQFGALGFRAGVLYRNPEWYDALDFSYDMSIPNVAHLDPQRGGCCTVFPYFIGNMLELPVTTTQDYSVFSILKDYSIGLWKKQISLIREKHGLISLIVHPDFVIDRAARGVYAELLEYLAELRSQRQTWIALPGEVNRWWRLRSRMNLVREEHFWRIEGPGHERARIAYAVLTGDSLTYEFAQPRGLIQPAQRIS